MKYQKYPRIEKRKNGYYYACYVDAQGLSQRKSLRTQNQVQASVKFNRLLEEADSGVLGFSRIPKRLPFNDVVVDYLCDAEFNLAPSTLKRYQEILDNHLVPHFRKQSLKAITPKVVVHYIRKRQREKAASNTITKEVNLLSSIFQFALREELVLFNPVRSVSKPKIRLVRPHYTPTMDELLKILNHMWPGARRFFLALANTGCRLGEMSRANVRDADFETHTLRVIRKGGKEEFIPMNQVLEDVIREEFSQRTPHPAAPLFLNQYGGRYQKIRKALMNACKRARVPHCTHHSLRHAYATILHERGEDMGTISKLLGHANPTITQNIYVHWRDPQIRRAALGVEIGKWQKSGKPQKEGIDDVSEAR